MFSMNNFLRRLGGIFSFSISVPDQTILPSRSMLTFNRTVSPAINHNVMISHARSKNSVSKLVKT